MGPSWRRRCGAAGQGRARRLAGDGRARQAHQEDERGRARGHQEERRRVPGVVAPRLPQLDPRLNSREPFRLLPVSDSPGSTGGAGSPGAAADRWASLHNKERAMKATWMKLAAVGLVFAAAAAGEMYTAQTVGAAMDSGGYLYTLNNDGQQNGVVILARGANGALTQIPGSPVATGGKGLVVPEGGDFDAQGSVRIHGRFLLAVNPGSNSVAVFAIGEGGKLTPAPGSPYPSGGVTPLSVSASGDLVYVANQSHAYAMSSQAPNITGFRMSADGSLSPISGSI